MKANTNKLLKCYECRKEISILSRSCPHCGSKQQFKGYVFTRAEVKKMGVNGVMDFYNFRDRGGKIKVMNWKYWSALIFFIFCIVVFG